MSRKWTYIRTGRQAEEFEGKYVYWESGPTEKQPYDHRASGVIVGVQGKGRDATVWITYMGETESHALCDLKNLRSPPW
jgi:hypothetical protein